jgi:hypothetical protein
MNRYALVISGVVDVVVEQESTPTLPGMWIDVTNLSVGPLDKYDGNTFTKYVRPPEPRVITKMAFRFRLTDAEYVGILSAAKTDIEVAAWVETFNMSTTVDLDSQRTKDGLQNLVGKNLLTQARADEILSAPVQPGER